MKLRSILVALLLNGAVFAQAPQLMTYQSVIRNPQSQLLTNTNVNIRLSILKGSQNGIAVYVETHQITTNTNGLATALIGNGNPINGAITSINWGDGPYFLQTELDLNGGNNFLLFGTQQLVSVPYALYAETAGTTINGGGNGPMGPQGVQGADGVDGLSAYQIALANGYSGSVTDWLNSLIGPQGPSGTNGTATGIPGPQGEQGIQGLAGAQGPQGEQGEQGLPGTTGQFGSTVFTNTMFNVTSNLTSFTLIPGLTQTINVPDNAIVFVSANGGFQNTALGNTHAIVDLAIYIDGSASSVQRRAVAANTSSLGQIIGNWNLSGSFALTQGNHTIQIRVKDGGGSGTANIGGTNDLIKGNLTVMIIKQ